MLEDVINYVNIYKYIIDDIIIINDNNKYKIKKEFVTSFFIEKDFNNDMFPIFRIQCLVNDNMKKVVNSSKSEYIINIKKGYTRIESDGTLLKKDILYEKFINDIFINTNSDDKTIQLTEDINKKIIKENGTTDDGLSNNTHTVELYLFKKGQVESCRHLTNMIYSSVGVVDVMLSLLSDNIKNKCLISYPDNTSVYPNIILPNDVSLKGGIQYLQDVYGIYNTGYMLFIDFDITYMINKDLKCSAYQKNEITNIYLDFNPIDKMSGNVYGQVYDSSKKSIKIYSINEPKVLDNTSNIDKSMYSEIMSINTYNRQTNNIKIKSNSNNAIKVIDDKYNNKYYVNSHIHELNSLRNTVEAELNEIDVNILNPNKEYYIRFNKNTKNSKELEGNYKMIKCVTSFVKKDDDTFVSSSTVTFTR